MTIKNGFSQFFSVAMIALTLLAGCKKDATATKSTKKGMNKTTKGGLIGAGGGAVVGGIIGRLAGNTAAGAILGATVGGATGAVIGRRMDKQAEKLEKEMEGATVERIGEGIHVKFDSGILFATNSDELTPAAKANLDKMATVVSEPDNNETNILLEGHTDNTGSDAINQPLSERRARAVSNYLIAKGVGSARLDARGYGSTRPLVDNKTANDRKQNRRVEVAISANEKMKKEASATTDK